MCEQFHCLPSQAREELERDPDRTALRILELRAYDRVKAQSDAAKTQAEMPTGPLADLVLEITADQWKERNKRRGR